METTKISVEFFSNEESLSFIKGAQLIKIVTDSENNYRCELYFSHGQYFEAFFDLLEGGEFSYLIEVANERLSAYNHVDKEYNFISY